MKKRNNLNILYKLKHAENGFYYIITEESKRKKHERVIIPYEIGNDNGDNDRAMIAAFTLGNNITKYLNETPDVNEKCR